MLAFQVRVRRADLSNIAERIGVGIRVHVHWILASAQGRFVGLRPHVLRGAKPFGTALSLLVLLATTAALGPMVQRALEPYFVTSESLGALRTLIVALGGALTSATAIAFPVVIFSVQINFARLPHGLFSKLSSDWRLLGAFAISFLLAVGVILSSLIPDRSWVAFVLLCAGWSTILILILFLYAYQRALFLINPSRQLELVLKNAQKDMRRWVRKARRAASSFKPAYELEGEQKARSTHDIACTAYFQDNPHWTAVSSQAVKHAVSFARRYAEQGDHEVSAIALGIVVSINAAYVEAKGKTFYADDDLFHYSLSYDDFIDETLKHLWQKACVGVTRRDEEQIEQTFEALAALVRIYIGIDYSTEHPPKTHANLAVACLDAAVRMVIPHNLPNALTEGVRLMGQCADLFIVAGDPKDIAGLSDQIAAVAAECVTKKDHGAVVTAAMDQFARLTFNLLRAHKQDTSSTFRELRKNVSVIVKLFMTTPNSPHKPHDCLQPYYRLRSDESFIGRLGLLAGHLAEAHKDDEAARSVIQKLAEWSDGLYRSEKESLLAGIERKSYFVNLLIRWIAYAARILVWVAGSPACDGNSKEKLSKNASSLISILSCVPDEKEAVASVETWRMTETLFDVALQALMRDITDVHETARGLLVQWSCKGGRHHIEGLELPILERSIYALATLALWKDDETMVVRLKTAIRDALARDNAPDREIRDRAAQEIRRTAATPRRREDLGHDLESAMNRIDAARMRSLLEEIAALLSAQTADEAGEPAVP